jgi:hypothetical protein
MRRRSHQYDRGHLGWQGMVFAFGTAMAAAVWAWTANAVDVLHGVRDLDGTPRWLDTSEPAALELGGLDLRDVYTDALPAWGAAVANVNAPGGRALEAEAYARFESSIREVDALVRVAPEMRMAALDPARHGEVLVDAVAAWNHATDEAGVPVWVHPWVRGDGVFYVKTYEVLEDDTVQVGDASYRARYVSRLDLLNVVEGRIGSVIDHEAGAIVLVDRLRVLVAEEVWPLLTLADASHPDRPPLARVFAEPIREAVQASLGERAFRALERTAPAREQIVRTVDVIRGRGARCSRFRVKRVNWYGFAPDDLGLLWDFARRDSRMPCPSVRFDEVDRFRENFREIVSDAEAVDAAERLLGWAARAVLVHEARHAADDDREGAIGAWETCEACPDTLQGATLHEASAYIASFADPSTGVFAVYQACGVVRDSDGVHARAVREVLDAIEPGLCEHGPPEDLTARAAALELSWFGRDASVRPRGGVPERLPLRTRR